MRCTGDQLRNLSIRVEHPYFSALLTVDAINANCLRLSAQDFANEANIRGGKAAVFDFGEDVQHEIKIDLADCGREETNKIIVSASFSSPEDESTFWSAVRDRAGRRYASIEPNRWPRLPGRGQYTEAARLRRLSFLQEHTGIGLDEVATTSLDSESLIRMTESFIGTVEVPVGAAGPLLFRGQHTQGYLVYVGKASR